jgi:hypothetical protein
MKILKFLLIALLAGTMCISCDRKECDCELPSPAANTQILLLQVDYTTNTFVSGKELSFAQTADSFSIAKEYHAPGDFGYIKLFYSEIDKMIFYGDIIWMGCGDIHFPTKWKNKAEFDFVRTDDLCYPKNGFEIIYNNNYEMQDTPISENDFKSAWYALEVLQLVRDYFTANPDEKVKVYLYQPSVGVGNPADWKWIFILRRNAENPQ